MEMDIEEMFGVRRAPEDRYSDSEPDNESDDGGVNNPDDEAVEVPEPGRQAAAQPVKPKRVIQNPQPKLDSHRLAGPRGIPVLQKSFKDVKWKGKGYEKEDLDVLLKRLEHWAHRMFPKLPFNDTLEQIEKQGFKKPVQVLIKKLRLDMFTESELNGENPDVDNVRRGIDDEEQVVEEPTVDIFDELLSKGGFSTSQPTSSAPVATVPSIPVQNNLALTDEQKERLERNKRLAAERRLAKLKKKQEEEERLREQEEDAFTSSDQQMELFDELRGSEGVSTGISSTPNVKESQTKQDKEDEAKDKTDKKNKSDEEEDMETDTTAESQTERKVVKANEDEIDSSDNELVIAENDKDGEEEGRKIEENDKDAEKEGDLRSADDILDMIEEDGEK